VPRGLFPALTVAACAAVLLPAVPAAAADPVTTTIQRDGVTLQFQRSTTATPWPLAVQAVPEHASARFDLNGDGVDELIVGMPVYPATGTTQSALLVRYADGTTERLVKQTASTLASALSVADFNGDGVNDLAIGDGAALWVLNGSVDGLRPESAIRLTAASPGMPAGGGDLGGVEAPGDLNGDGFADLVIGQQSQLVSGSPNAGAVTVLYGGSTGLSGIGSSQISQESEGVPGSRLSSDLFGSSVAIGDVTGDAHPDVVVGARGDGDADMGSVTVLPGTATGPTGIGATMVLGSQLDDLSLQTRELGDQVAVADVTGDGRADVVAGAHNSTVGGRQLSGVVVVLRGAADGISAGYSTVWDRDSPDVAGAARSSESFGDALTLGDVTGDGRPDLVSGSEWAAVDTRLDAGVATIIPNSATGLTGVGSAQLSRSTGRTFGVGVQAVELTGGGARELLVAGTQSLTLWQDTSGEPQAVASLVPGTFGAGDLGIADIGSTTRFPQGMPLAVPAGGPSVPVPPVLSSPRSRFDLDGDGLDEQVVVDVSGPVVRYSKDGRYDELAARYDQVGGDFSVAAGDFNGDGFADLAFGDGSDGSDNPAIQGQGMVWVAYGGPSGLDYHGAQKFSQETPGVPGSSEAGDGFGARVAAGDLNGDGRADLAIGAPGEAVGSVSAAGAVTILYGGATGLSATGASWFAQSDSWVPGEAETDDRFGGTLAIGDVTGDKIADLAVAAPGENGAVGMISLVRGAAGGVATSGVTAVLYTDLKLSTASGADFGTALAVADTDKDGKAEVIAGAPAAADVVSGKLSAGVVVSLKGGAAGLSKTAFSALAQDTAGVPGSAENGDGFGSSLGAGDVTGDGYADILIGSPGEAIGSLPQAGMVTLVLGGATGLTGAGSSGFDQSQSAVPGSAEGFDRFGQGLSLLNIDGTGGLDAVVGSPGEVLGTDNQSGSATTFTAGGTTLLPTGTWTSETISQSGNSGTGYVRPRSGFLTRSGAEGALGVGVAAIRWCAERHRAPLPQLALVEIEPAALHRRAPAHRVLARVGE